MTPRQIIMTFLKIEPCNSQKLFLFCVYLKRIIMVDGKAQLLRAQWDVFASREAIPKMGLLPALQAC